MTDQSHVPVIVAAQSVQPRRARTIAPVMSIPQIKATLGLYNAPTLMKGTVKVGNSPVRSICGIGPCGRTRLPHAGQGPSPPRRKWCDATEQTRP
jgi:hypothetical protein